MLSWSTVHRRIVRGEVFDAFLAGREVAGPGWPITPAEVRALMLDFLGHLRGLRVTPRTPRRPAAVAGLGAALASDVEQFYLFMPTNKDAAAAALAEPGWLRLGAAARRLLPARREATPARHRGHERDVIDDDAFDPDHGRRRAARRAGRRRRVR